MINTMIVSLKKVHYTSLSQSSQYNVVANVLDWDSCKQVQIPVMLLCSLSY